jgi:hypothetical protein
MSSTDIDAIAQSERIIAGPRVFDLVTGKTGPLSDYSGALRLTAYTSDLATLYSSPDRGGDSQVDCVAAAYKVYNRAMEDARTAVDLCLIQVSAAWVLAMSACTASLLLGLGALLAIAICIAVALAGYILAMGFCAAAYLIKVNTAASRLQQDLAACGVFLYQT